MKRFALAAILAAASFASAGDTSLMVRFVRGTTGKEVKVLVDGKIETSFAGKMGFQDAFHSWQSVCADVHSPVKDGQFFRVVARNSEAVGGNIAKAGRIVARYFAEAQTPEQCAGLQIAVWEAIENGSDELNFTQGKFQVQADDETLSYAAKYYTAAQMAGGAGGGQGSAPAAGGGQGSASPGQQQGGGGSTLLQTQGGSQSGGGQSQLSP
jgi:hypothetical protein